MRRLLLIGYCLAALAASMASPAVAQETAGGPSPEQLRALAELLRDPQIQQWLARQSEAAVPTEAPAPAAPEPAPAAGIQHVVAQWLAAAGGNLREVLATAPRLPEELRHIGVILSLELQEHGFVRILLLLLAFVGLGFGVEYLYWRATTGYRQRLIDMTLDSVAARLSAVGRRLVFGLCWVLAFAIGSIGAFLLFTWPPLIKEIVISFLLAFLVVRLALVLGSFLLAPGAERFRILPMTTESARYWRLWLVVIIGWFAFGRLALNLLMTLGMSLPALQLVRMCLALIWLGLALYAVWGRPRTVAASGTRLADWALTAVLVALWSCTVIDAIEAFWIGLILLLLVLFMRGGERAVSHLLRPPGSESAADAGPSLLTVVLERGLRTALIVGAAVLIAHNLGLDLHEITTGETRAARILAGLINAVVILLVADFGWHVLRTWIDQKLADAARPAAAVGSEEARRRGRLRTLLPIVRNVLMVVLAAMAVMMALASLGVQIGPLIAGAGIVGVAVGFGAQTLVKDIISGMFYLLDDAFRVGEYIQSGSYKGTVESFSLRSVKLRHHRGPLYTVPFGELGAVQNMSRDWVIDKLTIGVTYDTDLDKVKKVIKEVSKELMADPELAPHFLEPLKMQGVDAFGDFAIQVRMKMTTKPGEQFPIRRRAYALIKKAFNANGIEFAFPTVTVAGGEGEATPAVAQRGLELVRPPQPA